MEGVFLCRDFLINFVVKYIQILENNLVLVILCDQNKGDLTAQLLDISHRQFTADAAIQLALM